jgi:hypothetical protein
MQSIFTNKNSSPTDADLFAALGVCFEHWQHFVDYTLQCYPNAVCEWNFSSEKYSRLF